jgi:hypothetical protein
MNGLGHERSGHLHTVHDGIFASRLAHDSNAAMQHFHPARLGPSTSTEPDISTDWQWRIPMKKMILAAFAVFGLGMASAFAQGLPAGTVPPVYGSQAFPDQPYHTGTVFQEIFGHSKGDQPPVDWTTEQSGTPAKGE